MDLKVGKNVLDLEIKALELLKKNLNETFKKVVNLLFKTKGKIIICLCFELLYCFHRSLYHLYLKL